MKNRKSLQIYAILSQNKVTWFDITWFNKKISRKKLPSSGQNKVNYLYIKRVKDLFWFKENKLFTPQTLTVKSTLFVYYEEHSAILKWLRTYFDSRKINCLARKLEQSKVHSLSIMKSIYLIYLSEKGVPFHKCI